MLHVKLRVRVQRLLNLGQDAADLSVTFLGFFAAFTLDLEGVRADFNRFKIACCRRSSAILLFIPEILLYQIR